MMIEYHKIQTVYKRDPENKYKTLLEGEFALPEFEFLQDLPWFATEKVDGTNIRVIFVDGGFIFKGKTDKAEIPKFLLENLEKMFYPLLDYFLSFVEEADTEICLYGEGYGPKIQKGGGNYRDDCSFVLFDININGIWIKRNAMLEIADGLEIETVPLLKTGTLVELIEIVKGGFQSRWGDFIAEGFVMKPKVELRTRMGDRIITKVKCKDF